MKITYFCDACNLFSLAGILNFAVSKSVFQGLEPRNLWIVFWPLTKLSTCVYHIRKGNKYLKKNKVRLLYRYVKSCFHLAAILNFAVSWCEAWNPLLGIIGDGCSEDPTRSWLEWILQNQVSARRLELNKIIFRQTAPTLYDLVVLKD